MPDLVTDKAWKEDRECQAAIEKTMRSLEELVMHDRIASNVKLLEHIGELNIKLKNIKDHVTAVWD